MEFPFYLGVYWNDQTAEKRHRGTERAAAKMQVEGSRCAADGIMTTSGVHMSAMRFEVCLDCGVRLPVSEGPTHRYPGAGAACWTLYSALQGGGEPPIAAGPLFPLLVDAYAAQHHGVPSNQATQSVAVHLLALYGILEMGVDVAKVISVRTHSLRAGVSARHARFVWLEPPPLAALGALTVADIAQGRSPQARYDVTARYIHAVWDAWKARHAAQVAAWYEQYVVPDRL